jgi:ribosomal protein S6--L-glutamate ligase
MLLSFNPVIKGDLFLWERAPWDDEVLSAIRRAGAIVLPQAVSREFYWLCRRNCEKVFPNYDLRFTWEGKMGDTLLFWSYRVPHPRTVVYPLVESLLGDHPEMMPARRLPDFPFVIKAAEGGGGSCTWLIHGRDDLARIVDLLQRRELEGFHGFVIQEYLADLTRDLRVVVIGKTILSYWRCGSGFLHNVARGGEIDTDADDHLQERGRQAVRSLCSRTGINLAGFDLVYPAEDADPVFLEINYTFGRAGLGGSEVFYSHLRKCVREWLRE